VACNIGRIAVVLDGMDLTDAEWAVLEPTFRPRRRPDGRGRPWIDPRAVMNGVLWVLRTGAPWHDLPSRYPPYQTCHRRFQLWQRSGRLDRLLQRLAEDLRDRGKIDLSEAFVDATFASAKKGRCGRSDTPWQRHQGHGDLRPRRSSCCRARRQRLTV
jgi:transposase